MRGRGGITGLSALACLLAHASAATAQAPLEAPGAVDDPEPEEPAKTYLPEPGSPPPPPSPPDSGPPPKPAPYSLPWALRPAAAVNVVRSDSVIAAQDAGATFVTFLTGSVRVAKDVAISARWGWVHDAPRSAPSRSALTNVALSGTWVPQLGGGFRVAVSSGVVLPLGQGGGAAADPDRKAAIGSGVYARSAMDNAMFGPNEIGFFGGLALAYVAAGFTAQLEGTIFEVVRVTSRAAQPEETKMNSTWGAHVGYFVVPQLSLSMELRYQAFFQPPKAVATAPVKRDAATFAVGVRVHVPVGTHYFRPGVAYAHPLDDPTAAAGYRVVQFDLPFVF